MEWEGLTECRKSVDTGGSEAADLLMKIPGERKIANVPFLLIQSNASYS